MPSEYCEVAVKPVIIFQLNKWKGIRSLLYILNTYYRNDLKQHEKDTGILIVLKSLIFKS